MCIEQLTGDDLLEVLKRFQDNGEFKRCKLYFKYDKNSFIIPTKIMTMTIDGLKGEILFTSDIREVKDELFY